MKPIKLARILLISVLLSCEKSPPIAAAFSLLTSKVVTTITPKSEKLHFRKDKRSPEGFLRYHKKYGRQTFQWRCKIVESLNNTEVGKTPKELLDQVPRVLTSCARDRTSEGAKQAQLLLNRYVREVEAGNRYAAPEVQLFNIAMDAWVKSRRSDAPEKIKGILKTMQDLRLNHNLSELIPDVISLSLFCLAWARSREPIAAEKAHEILNYMERRGLRPNTFTYNAVLLSHVHSNKRDKALAVESLINHMKERCNAGNTECCPDICSYQSLIAAWSRTSMYGTPQKAEEVLHFLDEESRNGKEDLRPNCHCYVAAIHAWSHSEELEKSRRAYELLQHMRDLYEQDHTYIDLKPNVVAYTAVLNACALPADKGECQSALQIAQLVMEEMRLYKYDQPNFLTFSAFLQVLSSTLPHGKRRDQLALETFEQACASGQVGYLTLEKLQHASPKTYNNFVKDLTEKDRDGNHIVQIPFEW
eukprot:CAMPEP_0178918908 /NCGR_PEP_ID=MMETSP0786-20121207/14102_1 /TAXON_ID=186022 /ORGANISM="Thalassionema frauenfeldii, Strain CCMP 1798" /LENGTH=474 /DNA_ID=CAMNT_0020592699 /DNA_START=28 /DNA_END=1449 /DNA_ORIENTATION=+